MTIASMTGFARSEGECQGCAWTWEAKSVNARNLDVRCRLPAGFEGLDTAVRQKVAAALKRGNVQVNLQLAWSAGQQGVRINAEALEQVLGLVAQIEARLGTTRPPSADGLLALRGVIDVLDPTPSGEARAVLEAALLNDLGRTVAHLVKVRAAEGERLEADLSAFQTLLQQARAVASTQPEAIFARLNEQVTALLAEHAALPADRLAQEAALLAAKADPREELDRLRAHHQAAMELLNGQGPVGRQLDFLCQELNREANTLCAKSADIELTRVGLDLKSTVEQVREQIQNVE